MRMKLTWFERQLDRMVWRWFSAGTGAGAAVLVALQHLGIWWAVAVYLAIIAALALLSTWHVRRFAARVTREANEERARR
jgi:membrane protein implicated in regulation of membrane protease activity